MENKHDPKKKKNQWVIDELKEETKKIPQEKQKWKIQVYKTYKMQQKRS